MELNLKFSEDEKADIAALQVEQENMTTAELMRATKVALYVVHLLVTELEKRNGIYTIQ